MPIQADQRALEMPLLDRLLVFAHRHLALVTVNVVWRREDGLAVRAEGLRGFVPPCS